MVSESILSKTSKKKEKIFQKLSALEKTVAIVILAAVLVGVCLPNRIIVSTSPSLTHRIFFLIPVNRKKIRTGDYLVFEDKDADILFIRQGLNKKNDRLIKKVGCAPGDILTQDADRAWHCGQEELGTPLKTDSRGRKLPRFRFAGIIPPGSYFMVGDNPRSFDSKYFGFVHADDFLYKALPLW